MNEAWLALIGALVGGSGLKVIEHWLNREKERDNSASDFRKELRDEVVYLREELRKVEKDADRWRTQYYVLTEQHMRYKAFGEETAGSE